MPKLLDLFPAVKGNCADVAAERPDVSRLILTSKTGSLERLGELSKLSHLMIWTPPAAVWKQIVQLPKLEFLMVGGNIERLPKDLKMPRLQTFVFWDVGKLGSLDGVQSMTGLKALGVFNAKSVRDYGPIGALKQLERLEIGATQHYERLAIDSLDWMGTLTKLREAYISFNKIGTNSGRVLGKLTGLKKLFIAGHSLPREEFAYLAGALRGVAWGPLARQFSEGHSQLEAGCPKCGKRVLVLMVGRRQGVLCRHCDAIKFGRLHDSYREAVQAARATHA